MKRRGYKYYLRKAHRYLGIAIGIQFLLWTLGGLYFSWTNIDEIRGEHLRGEGRGIGIPAELTSPEAGIREIQSRLNISKITAVRLIEILGTPAYVYEVELDNGDARTVVTNAASGRIRPLLSEDEAKRIAAASLVKPMNFREAVLLTAEGVGTHHEYREKPLPAWALTYETGTTVYVSAETGEIGAFRTNKWRIFDFLWMLHTMDFEGRDNINNYLLRGFSVLGMITVLSGFSLFVVSSRFIRSRFRGR